MGNVLAGVLAGWSGAGVLVRGRHDQACAGGRGRGRDALPGGKWPLRPHWASAASYSPRGRRPSLCRCQPMAARPLIARVKKGELVAARGATRRRFSSSRSRRTPPGRAPSGTGTRGESSCSRSSRATSAPSSSAVPTRGICRQGTWSTRSGCVVRSPIRRYARAARRTRRPRVERCSARQPGYRQRALRTVKSRNVAAVPGPAASSATIDFGLFDRTGKGTPLKLPLGAYSGPRISPDGGRLAFTVAAGRRRHRRVDLSERKRCGG